MGLTKSPITKCRNIVKISNRTTQATLLYLNAPLKKMAAAFNAYSSAMAHWKLDSNIVALFLALIVLISKQSIMVSCLPLPLWIPMSRCFHWHTLLSVMRTMTIDSGSLNFCVASSCNTPLRSLIRKDWLLFLTARKVFLKHWQLFSLNLRVDIVSDISTRTCRRNSNIQHLRHSSGTLHEPQQRRISRLHSQGLKESRRRLSNGS